MYFKMRMRDLVDFYCLLVMFGLVEIVIYFWQLRPEQLPDSKMN